MPADLHVNRNKHMYVGLREKTPVVVMFEKLLLRNSSCSQLVEGIIVLHTPEATKYARPSTPVTPPGGEQ